jgi:hypothetical protein
MRDASQASFSPDRRAVDFRCEATSCVHRCDTPLAILPEPQRASVAHTDAGQQTHRLRNPSRVRHAREPPFLGTLLTVPSDVAVEQSGTERHRQRGKAPSDDASNEGYLASHARCRFDRSVDAADARRGASEATELADKHGKSVRPLDTWSGRDGKMDGQTGLDRLQVHCKREMPG